MSQVIEIVGADEGALLREYVVGACCMYWPLQLTMKEK